MVTDDQSRGQIILISAIVIAIGLIAITVILNTVLFTENVNNIGTIASANDGLNNQIAQRDSLTTFVRQVNGNDTYATPKASKQALNRSLHWYSDLLGVTLAKRQPVLVNLSVPSTPTVGALVVQANNRSFTDADHESQWTLDSNTQVRQYTMSIAHVSANNSHDAFAVSFNGSGGTNQKLRFYRRTDGTLLVKRDGTVSDACSLGSGTGNTTIDFWTGKIQHGGRDCGFIGANSLTTPKIEYDNGKNATGTYRLLTNGTSIQSSPFNASADESPYLTYVVYRASIRSQYVTPDLSYDSEIHLDLYEPGSTTVGAAADGGSTTTPTTATTTATSTTATTTATTATTTTTPTATTTTPTATPTPTPTPTTTTSSSNHGPHVGSVHSSLQCQSWSSCAATVDWTASDPDGSSDLSQVTVRVVKPQWFAPDEVVGKKVVTSGDLTHGSVTIYFDSDGWVYKDYVVVTVTDRSGASDSEGAQV